jgi:hypothetical protein
MLINNIEVMPSEIDEAFLKNLPKTSEKDVDKILNYIRKRISKRAKQLKNAGDKDGLNTARREANAKYGRGWRECMLLRTIYTRPQKKGNNYKNDWCPEEGRDFGYPNSYWK